MSPLEPLDVGILLSFVAYALAAGMRARRLASASPEEYFLAGRSLSGTRAGISMAATQFAADTPLLVTGLVATAGVFALWRLWIYAVAFLLMGFVLAPAWRRARVLTDAELAELRYGGRAASVLRTVKALYFGTVFNCTVLAMVLWAAKEIAEPFLHWHAWLPAGPFADLRGVVEAVGVPFAREVESGVDLWTRSSDNLLSILLLLGVTLAYSATGGLRSVVRTDQVQFALMLLGTALFAWFAVDAAGGMEGVRARLASGHPPGGPNGGQGLSLSELLAFTPDRARDAGPAVLAVVGLQWLVQMNADGTGYLAQRSMACRSDADARRAALVFTWAQVGLRSLLWLPLSLALLALFPADPAIHGDALRADREGSYVRGMVELLPAGARGLLLTAMLAALASTIDTHLNWGASYWAHDLWARFVARRGGREPEPQAEVRVARLASVGIALLSLVIMTRLGSIQTAWQLSLLLGAGMGVMLVLRWLCWWVNAWGELAAIGTSAALAPLLLYAVPAEREALRLLCMAAGSTAAGVCASFLTPAESPERLRSFWERARPPGFWVGGVGEVAAGGARRLARGLLATSTGAASLFCLLVGSGTWLIHAPAPAGLPRGAWIAGLLGLGLALVPCWWRLGSVEDDRVRARG
jgi:Na+/proline symporter